jgi:hypothetical protein
VTGIWIKLFFRKIHAICHGMKCFQILLIFKKQWVLSTYIFFSLIHISRPLCAIIPLTFFLRFACRRIFQSNFSPFLYAKAKTFDKQQNVFSAVAVVLAVLGICIIFDWASTERKHFTTKIRVPPILCQ